MNQIDLEFLYNNQLALDSVEKLLPTLPESMIKAINVFRTIRSYLLIKNLNGDIIPINHICHMLKDAGIPLPVARSIEAIFIEQFCQLHSISFNLLIDMELSILKKFLLKEINI
ncbi:MAG TPA: hypothetical protein DDW29_13655 [Gammaproteobacteria bacterium]|nr:hypothetical protein [Gammaproteobacteria bacterium]|tara:strand:- start:903 stop:1244 length:342 start_codon:yes stop_codon:yes gene_type:complete